MGGAAEWLSLAYWQVRSASRCPRAADPPHPGPNSTYFWVSRPAYSAPGIVDGRRWLTLPGATPQASSTSAL